MKILHFIGSMDKSAGGTASYMQLIAKELSSYIDLAIVTGASANPLEVERSKVFNLDLNLKKWFLLRRQFEVILRQEKPDLVHINGIWDPQNWLFQRTCQKLNIKVLISPHGMLEPYILARNPYKKKIALSLYQRKAIKTANFLHATANSELEQIRKLGFNSPGRVIPNGIDISEVQKKQNCQKVNTTMNLLFLSRVHPKKGLELLIDALAQLKKHKIQLTIAGEGDQVYVEELKNLVRIKGLDEQVIFVGGVYGKDKWLLYQEADLFILPTYSENFGIVIIEALAAGVPVITTKGTPWKDLQVHQCGWWIDLSVSTLSQTISAAVNLGTERLRNMGENGRQLVQEKYDIKAVASETYMFYQSILADSRYKEN